MSLNEFIEAHSSATHGIGCVDLIFMKVGTLGNPKADELSALVRSHQGEFLDCDPFDGLEHGYIELGAWLGSQEHALRLMGIGAALGLWELYTPRRFFPGISERDAMDMAGGGYITIRATKGKS